MAGEQTAANVLAAIKREGAATPGTAAAAGAGALQLRLIDSTGLNQGRGTITSNERLASGFRPMGRLGGRSVGGTFNAELTVGGATDSLLEAALRRVWTPALATASADMGAGTFTTTTNTLVASAGNWITRGVRVGDVGYISNDTTAANNNVPLRVTTVSATTLTFAGNPLTLNAVGRALTFTVLKKLTTLGLPTRYSYTVEQYDADIDLSELFLGCRLTGIAIALRPNAIGTIAYTFSGMSRIPLVQGTSPWFTNPSVTVGLPLVADDSAIRFNGADVTKFTSMDLNIAIAANAPAVIGSTTSPNVFDNDATVTGTVAGIREDFSRLQMFDNETEFELSAFLREPTSALSGLGFHMPRVKLSSLEAPFLGSEGPKVETMALMTGAHAGNSFTDASVINVFSTAP